MSKAALASQELLGKVFPAEFVTRNVGHAINFPKSTQTTCTDYISKVATDADQLNYICTKYKFDNLVDLRLFVNGTWFGQIEAVMNGTGLNAI